MPPPHSGALSDARLTSVWRLSFEYIGPKSRTERPRKTEIGTEVAHATRDSNITFKVNMPKVNLQEAGAYCGGLPHSLLKNACAAIAKAVHQWWANPNRKLNHNDYVWLLEYSIWNSISHCVESRIARLNTKNHRGSPVLYRARCQNNSSMYSEHALCRHLTSWYTNSMTQLYGLFLSDIKYSE